MKGAAPVEAPHITTGTKNAPLKDMMTPHPPLLDRQECAVAVSDDMLEALPGRVRDIATLRGLGYSCREIGRRLGITPQAVSATLMRHRRRLRHVGTCSELMELSARAANALASLGVRSRADAGDRDLLVRLRYRRNCGSKTLDEISRWLEGSADTSWSLDES
jgi:DNA-binding CsgD family transcriptional regulator